MSGLLRFYELMGCEVNREAGSVKIDAQMATKPVEIIVQVRPDSMTASYGRETVLATTVLFDDERTIDWGLMEVFDHQQELNIPVSQLRFLVDELPSDDGVEDRMYDAIIAVFEGMGEAWTTDDSGDTLARAAAQAAARVKR